MKKSVFLWVVVFGLMWASCAERVKKVKITTEHGDIICELYNSTPLHRDNFVELIKTEYYEELLFHRVIHQFMIQGGDPESKDATPTKRLGMGGPEYTIPAEIGALHYRGALCAARRGDNVNPDRESSGSQFYIVQGMQNLTTTLMDRAENQHGYNYSDEERNQYMELGGYPFLDNQYTVFGRVIEGMDVVDKIAEQPVEKDGSNRPVSNITMSITMIK